MEDQQKLLEPTIGFNFYQDNTQSSSLSKKRKLSQNSQSSNSTREKQELNESFKRMDLKNSNESGPQHSTQNSIPSPQNYQRIPIRPTPRHPLHNQLFLEQIGIQKYLSLDNEPKMNDILKQQNQNLKELTISEILGRKQTRSFHSSDQESERKLEEVQNVPKRSEFQKRIFYPYGVPANFAFLVKSSQDVLQKKIEEETQKYSKLVQDNKLEESLFKQTNFNLMGQLTREERAEKVKQYLEKKRSRTWQTIRYQVRKSLAQNRERVQGRFTKSSNKVQFNQSIGALESSIVKPQGMSQSWEGASEKKLEKDNLKFLNTFAKNNNDFNYST